MRESLLPAAGIVLTLGYGGLVAWLYAARPQSFAEVATHAEVAAGVYRVDEARFASGLELFRREQYAAARDEWSRADPALRDVRTQFYVSYAFYRQGWGRVRPDEALYRQGLAAADRAQALSQSPWATDDPDLKLRTPAELKAELQRGLTTEWEDFNPLHLLEPRK